MAMDEAALRQLVGQMIEAAQGQNNELIRAEILEANGARDAFTTQAQAKSAEVDEEVKAMQVEHKGSTLTLAHVVKKITR